MSAPRAWLILHLEASMDESRAGMHFRAFYSLLHAIQQDASKVRSRIDLNRTDDPPPDPSSLQSDLAAARADASDKEREIIRLERITDAILDATGTDPENAQMGRETLRTHAPEMARRLGMMVEEPPPPDPMPGEETPAQQSEAIRKVMDEDGIPF